MEANKNQKMREALERCVKMLDICLLYSYEGYPAQNDDIREVMAQAENALAAPPRNCDIYTTTDKARWAYHMQGDGLMTMQAFCDWFLSGAKGAMK